MLYESFKTVEKLDNVESISSNADTSPLQDPSITIFLKNGYRVISNKSVFGQSLEVENTSDSNMPTYKSEIYHQFISHTSSLVSKFYQKKNGNKQEIDKSDFSKKIAAVTGKAVYAYLAARHKSATIPLTINNTIKELLEKDERIKAIMDAMSDDAIQVLTKEVKAYPRVYALISSQQLQHRLIEIARENPGNSRTSFKI